MLHRPPHDAHRIHPRRRTPRFVFPVVTYVDPDDPILLRDLAPLERDQPSATAPYDIVLGLEGTD